MDIDRQCIEDAQRYRFIKERLLKVKRFDIPACINLSNIDFTPEQKSERFDKAIDKSIANYKITQQ